MIQNNPLRRGVDGVCTRSACECEREGLGDQCVWLKPAVAEFECLGEPSLCTNPRGCDCQAPSEPRPSCKTPEGCRENGCLGWCDEYRPDPALKPDIAALKKRLSEDPGFAAQVMGEQAAMRPELALFFRDLRNHLLHVIDMSKGEHYLDVVRLNAQALIRRIELLAAAQVTGDRPLTPGCHTPEGCRENGCLGWCDEHRPDYAKGPLPETGWD